MITYYEPRLLSNPKKPETSGYTIALLEDVEWCSTVDEAIAAALEYIMEHGGDEKDLVIAKLDVTYMTPTLKQIRAVEKKLFEGA